jgi:hypothetical protein
VSAETRFDSIVEDLAMLGVTSGVMFGKRGVAADGKVVAVLLGDTMAFRLGEETPAHAEALGLPGAELWDPSTQGHPFKDWVRVPYDSEDHWGHFAELALRRIREKL